jgi:hypothetical protein
MLNRPKDLFSVEPPFLILFGDGTWAVAREIFPAAGGVGYVEPFAEEIAGEPRHQVVPGVPFHVGGHVWDLDYNNQIMTLDHPYHRKHPAWAMWLRWLQWHHFLSTGSLAGAAH